MVNRKQDQFPNILKFFRLASPKENEGSSSEAVKSAELETRPTLKTTVIDGLVKGWSLSNPLSLEAGYGPEEWVMWPNLHFMDTKQLSKETMQVRVHCRGVLQLKYTSTISLSVVVIGGCLERCPQLCIL